MRVNKYKVWDKENNKWFEPTYEAYKGNLEYLMLSPEGDLSMVTMGGIVHESMFPDRFDIVFFTGLKGKNDKDIYEGDLIRNYQTGESPNPLGEVSFEYGGWHYDCYHASALPLDSIASESEVIGNVYENPELLK